MWAEADCSAGLEEQGTNGILQSQGLQHTHNAEVQSKAAARMLGERHSRDGRLRQCSSRQLSMSQLSGSVATASEHKTVATVKTGWSNCFGHMTVATRQVNPLHKTSSCQSVCALWWAGELQTRACRNRAKWQCVTLAVGKETGESPVSRTPCARIPNGRAPSPGGDQGVSTLGIWAASSHAPMRQRSAFAQQFPG